METITSILNDQVVLDRWVTDNVPQHLAKLFWEQLNKWDESLPRSETYSKSLLSSMLDYAKEKHNL